jgi:uncharacterized phiE125 gp8 family phage protein
MDFGKIKIVTGATAEPVTLEETKNHLNTTHNEDDSEIRRLIRSARRWGERFQGRQYCSVTYDQWHNDFPGGRCIELQRAPLQSITSIKYQDTDDAEQTFSSGDYQFLTYDDAPGTIELDWDASWPTVYDKADAVVIRFVAGYGDETAVPDTIKGAILLHVQAHYDRPDPQRMGSLMNAAQDLLWQDKVEVV